MTALLDLSALSAFSLNSLKAGESSFADTVSRMSTGLQFTTAGDDIAAYMVSVRLDNRSRGWTEASRNIQNSLSLLEAADAGMASILDAFGRMRELAVESSSGVYTDDHRLMMQREVETLRQYVYDTIETTQFNSIKPLAGNASFAPPTIDLSLVLPTTAVNPSVTASTQTGIYAVNITQLGQRGALIGNNQAVDLTLGDPPTIMTITSQLGTVNVTITDADPRASWPGIINAAAAAIGVTAEITNAGTQLDDGTFVDPFNDGYLMFRTAGVGSDKSVSVFTNKFFDGTGFNSTTAATTGIDMQGTIEGTPFSASGLTITAAPGSNGADGLRFGFTAAPGLGAAGTVNVVVPAAVLSDFTHTVQMAPDHLDEHLVTIGSFKTGVMDDTGLVPNTLSTLSLATQLNALTGIDTLDALIQQVSSERTEIGSHMEALQGELTNAINGAYVTSSMEGRITDADMAAEATAMMQAQLAQQVQLSVLQALQAQSNAALEFMVSMLASSPLQAPAA